MRNPGEQIIVRDVEFYRASLEYEQSLLRSALPGAAESTAQDLCGAARGALIALTEYRNALTRAGRLP